MISDKIEILKTNIPKNITLVAVSKTKPVEMIEEACSKGHLDFGENKVQELVYKHESLPKNIRWHMIGHLQRNKVKYIAPFVHLIHGADSVKLLKEINKQGVKNNRKMMTDLISKSQKNADDLMNNKSQIKQRRNSALANRAKILANKSLIKF